MSELWLAADTTTHQDHVIAHVIGTTVLGYLLQPDAVHLLLDIGFIWKIYVDGEMGLLPHPVAVAEIELSGDDRKRIVADIDLLLRDGRDANPLAILKPLTVDCQIEEVKFFEKGERRKLVLLGEDAGVEFETSVSGESFNLVEVPK
jgi:hypothetical protein